MPEARTDRTDFLSLLAVMVASASSEGWAFPYWNMIQIDAALSAMASGLRDGTVPLEAPAAPPTLAMDVGGGYLSAGQVLSVVQTYVDQWGRETEAGAEATIDLGEGIGNPATAPSLGAPVTEGFGFEGGLLEAWYTWTDATGGETMASPVAQVNLPYLTAGLYSQVAATLPATPASVGASGANIYTRHRRGNVVMMTVITDASETQALLDGSTYNCYRALPLVNSTGSVRSIEITGVEAPEKAVKTRFYVRVAGQAWTAGDRRLRVGGRDEYDPDTVTYPLTYTGAPDELAPGWPPPTSQVFAIRPTDLATEVTGTLPASQLPLEAVLEPELVRSTGEAILSGFAVSAHTPADLGVRVAAGEALLAVGRVVCDITDLALPTADPDHPRIDLICIAADGAIEGPMENAALKGGPAAEPVAPSVPEGYISLAEVAVPAATASIVGGSITDMRWLVPTLVEAVLESRNAIEQHEVDADIHFTGTEKADRLLTAQQLTDLTDGGNTSLHTHSGLGSSGHPVAVTNLLHTILWIEDMVPVIRETLDARPQMWRELLAVATMVADMEAILAGSSRRTFTDEERACAGSATVDFTIDVIDEGLLVQVDLTIEGEDPDIDFSVYRDAGRDVLVKTWANITETSTHRELLDWLNEEDPQSGSAYCRVVNNTANEVTVTTVLTIKEA